MWLKLTTKWFWWNSFTVLNEWCTKSWEWYNGFWHFLCKLNWLNICWLMFILYPLSFGGGLYFVSDENVRISNKQPTAWVQPVVIAWILSFTHLNLVLCEFFKTEKNQTKTQRETNVAVPLMSFQVISTSSIPMSYWTIYANIHTHTHSANIATLVYEEMCNCCICVYMCESQYEPCLFNKHNTL